MSTVLRNRVEVMHGVNLDQLGRRDPAQYGKLDLRALERQIDAWGTEIGLSVRCFQTNHEGRFIEHLHSLRDRADAVVLNPGAWTHYAYSIHDALEVTGLPAVEVHLSDVEAREPWRRVSVIRPLCLASFSGQGADGYREALQRLREELVA